MFQELIQETRTLREQQPKPFIFINTGTNVLGTDLAENTILAVGVPVPPGHRGSVRDFNVNFIISPAALTDVKVVIIDTNRNIIQDLILDIGLSSNEVGSIVLEQGEALAVAAQTQGVDGELTAFCSGDIQKI